MTARKPKKPAFRWTKKGVRAVKIPPPLEHAEAVAFMEWVRLNEAAHPELRWLHAIPNGGDRNVIVAAKMKAEGVRKGVLDYAWPVRAGRFPGMVFELKRVRLGKVSAEQKKWMDHYEVQGWHVRVCYGAGEAIEAVKQYLSVLRVKNPQAIDDSRPAKNGCDCVTCQREYGPFNRTMSLCPKCRNKRCPKADWHGLKCTNSNELGQAGELE